MTSGAQDAPRSETYLKATRWKDTKQPSNTKLNSNEPGRTTMPVSLELLQKKSWHQRQRLLRGWINLPSVEVTALRNWIDGTPRPVPPTAPQQQPARTPNPPTHTNNEPPGTLPTRLCLTIIDKRLLPRATKPNPCLLYTSDAADE